MILRLLTLSALALPAVFAAPAASNPSNLVSIAAISASGRPRPTTVASAPSETETVKPVTTDPDEVIFWPEDEDPQAVRGQYGAEILGPKNAPLAEQYQDTLAPPTTDEGSLMNSKWPFSLSHNRFQTGGWARQQNIDQLPIATEMAGVNMRLTPGSIRELHWHSTAEWAYVLKGTTQITAIDSDGHSFIANVGPGDLWYFPPGIPHSLQALNDSNNEGTEFLLVFDDGSFSEDETFLLTDWLSHTPQSVINENFQTDPGAFAHVPSEELYIFPGPAPSPDQKSPEGPAGSVPDSQSFFFPLSKMNETRTPSGTVKIADSTNFKVAKTIAVAQVEIQPGGMREMHWHPTQDEWTFFLEGEARVTVFGSQSNAVTYNFRAGDIGYVPKSFGHYIQNTNPDKTLKVLEILKTDRYQDISLNQWLALTPPELVKAHLGVSDKTLSKLSKTKPIAQPFFAPAFP